MAWNPQQTLCARSTTINDISVTRYLGLFYRFG